MYFFYVQYYAKTGNTEKFCYKYSNFLCVFCGFTWHTFIKELISQTVHHMAHLRFDPLKALKVAHKAKCCELRLHNQAKQYD